MVPPAGGQRGANAVKRVGWRVKHLGRDSKHLHQLKIDPVADGGEHVELFFRSDVADQK